MQLNFPQIVWINNPREYFNTLFFPKTKPIIPKGRGPQIPMEIATVLALPIKVIHKWEDLI